MGGDHFALRTPDVAGRTVVVWHARRLPGPPADGEFEILQPSRTTYERLMSEARNGVSFKDDGAGELVAIKIALHGAEADLEKALNVLRQIGPRAVRLFYPRSGLGADDFPCHVVEWVSGVSVSDSAAFSEPMGLEFCAQVLALVKEARAAAPTIVLTEGLRPSNVMVAYDAHGAAQARIIDWNDYAAADEAGGQTMQRRLGELLADLFTDTTLEADGDVDEAAARKPSAARAWDRLSTITRDLIRRAARAEFDPNPDSALSAMTQIVDRQRERWNEADPLWLARVAEAGTTRLTWLDIAASKQGGLSAEARERLEAQRAVEMQGVIAAHTAEGRYAAAAAEARVGARRHSGDSYFRWALMANTAGALGPEAYGRLRLDAALAHLSAGEYAQARHALDGGRAFFDAVQFAPEQRERARDAVLALSNCAHGLALCNAALNALNDNWNVEDAEAKLALAEDRLASYDKLAATLLGGRDSFCQQRVATVKAGIAEFYEQHGRYDPHEARRETAEQARRANLNRLVERSAKLAQAAGRPDSWSAGLGVLHRAAAEYPDLWNEDHETARAALVEKIARHELQGAKAALAKGDWAGAGAALAAAMQCPATLGDAARLQAALWAYQRGEVELQRDDTKAALASFKFAADHSQELRAAAEARAQAVQSLGVADSGDPLSVELDRRFAEQQEALRAAVQAAVTAAQQQALGQQVAALRQAHEEGAAKTAAFAKSEADAQDRRLQAALAQMREQLAGDQDAATRKSQADLSKELRSLLTVVLDEHAETHRLSIETVKKEQAKHFEDMQAGAPSWFTAAQREERQLRDEQAERMAAALKSIDEAINWMRTAASKAEAQAKAEKPATALTDEKMQELGFRVEGASASVKSMQGRLNFLVLLNTLLLLGLALVMGATLAYVYVPAVRNLVPLPQIVTVTEAPVTAPTQAAPADSPTASLATQPVPAALACPGSDQPGVYFDCTVTNTAAQPGALTLSIQPQRESVQGFFYEVLVSGQPAQPQPGETAGQTTFDLGSFSAGEAQPVRVRISCVRVGGCPPSAFDLSIAGLNGPLSTLTVQTP